MFFKKKVDRSVEYIKEIYSLKEDVTRLKEQIKSNAMFDDGSVENVVVLKTPEDVELFTLAVDGHYLMGDVKIELLIGKNKRAMYEALGKFISVVVNCQREGNKYVDENNNL